MMHHIDSIFVPHVEPGDGNGEGLESTNMMTMQTCEVGEVDNLPV
jgi:hypothetical protein